ncbi:hypothetical protein [Paenibacillus sp. N3.4]|uniref:hypothetical protein n=1 Tax=Paenibacillus sp. N3.4 TaxID=2603222 RepID=UPI0011C88C3F|nr:hypothetical protein [Paenibacillus sp. N3.4]TXK71806.1 hypothetical protein FU659_32400 [Paenibacillus sp. N3.4]
MKTFRGISMLAAAALLISGCGSSKKSVTPVNSYIPTLEVNATVNGDNLNLAFTTDMIVSKEHYDHEKKQGEGHFHVALDQGEKITVTAKQQMFEHLSKGTHIVKVSLHNNDHTPYDVSKTVNFEIK